MNQIMKLSGLSLLCGLALVLSACGTEAPAQQTATVPAPTSTMPATAMSIVPTATPAPAQATETVTSATGSASLSASIRSIEDWRDIVMQIAGAAPAEAQARADSVWRALVDANRVPLVLGNVVVFLYKGHAQSVVWRGVFTHWKDMPPLAGRSIGNTDLWVAQTTFPSASRAEYKIVLDNKNWINDPGNKQRVPSGDTVNNVLVMPGFKSTDESQWRSLPISGTLSKNIPIASKNLGYNVNYRVWTPPRYEEDKLGNLPVIYVLDGSDFISPTMGAMPNVLNNMSSDSRIRPVMAVFIDPYEPGNPKNNRREKEFLGHSEEFARFVATEMVPTIDAAYRTDPRPDSRMIQGVSYGGLSATFIAVSYPQVFHHLAALSPAYWVLSYPEGLSSKDLTDGARKMAGPTQAAVTCGGDTEIQCPPLPLRIFLTFGYPDWDVGDLNSQVVELQQKNYPLKYIQVNEGHAWSAWRALLDEMLVNFAGN